MSDILDDRTYDPGSHQQHQVDPQAKQKKFVKVFGWITFGFACMYVLSSIWGVIAGLAGNVIYEMNNLPGVESELISQMEATQNWTTLIAVFALLLSVFFIIGSLKFVKFQELGRKMMVYGYIGAIVHTLMGMMVLWLGFSADEIFQAANMGDIPNADKAAGIATTMFTVVKVVSSIFQVAVIIFFVWLITQFNLDRVKAVFK